MLETKANRHGWFITVIGTLFLFYSALQTHLMTSLHNELIKEFNTTTAKVSLLSAWGFYANVLTLLPAGLLLDRFSVKKIMLINLTIAVFGTLVFAFAKALLVASIGRFLCGAMMSFGFIACLKLASYHLPPKEMARAASVIVSIGMMGGVCAQIVLTAINGTFGWRVVLFFVACVGILIMVILGAVLKDTHEEKKLKKALKFPVWEGLKEIIKQKQNWLSSFYICFLNLPISVLGALFGISYLAKVHHLTNLQASGVTSMLFIGYIIGAPIFAWISDKIQRRKPPMIVGAFLCLFFMLVILYTSHLSYCLLYLLFFLVGITSAAQVIGYPIIGENNRPRLMATAMSFAGLVVAAIGYGLALPLVGGILDATLAKFAAHGIEAQGPAFFRALSIIPLGIFGGIILSILIKETRCKPQKGSSYEISQNK